MLKKLFSEEWMSLPADIKSKELKSEYGTNELYFVHLDDDQEVLDSLTDLFANTGFKSFSTTDATKAIEFIESNQNQIAFVFVDLKMPSMSGLEFRKLIYEVNMSLPVAVLSGYVDKELALKGLELKISIFIEKDLGMSNILNLIYSDTIVRLNQIKDDLDLLNGFVSDAEMLAEQIEDAVLTLEEHPNDQELIAKIFGMVHTIKGSSGFFSPKTLHKYVHRFEEILKKIQSNEIQVNSNTVAVILQAIDWIKTFIDELKCSKFKNYDFNELFAPFEKLEKSGGKGRLDAAENTEDHGHNLAKANKSKDEEVIRVQVSVLDEFIQTSGEMTVVRNMINKVVKGIEKTYTGDKDILLLSDLLEELHKTNFLLQNRISELRKVPAKNLVKPLQRVVRDTANKLGKQVEFLTEGEELRIDTSISETLSNSLIHLIRNSLDHGIESPDQRLTSGKSKKGKISLSFRQMDEHIYVEIQDDGNGINTVFIRNKLMNNPNYSQSEVAKMTDDELMMQIFSAGFSTATQITDISGRGVGMSMVKDSVEGIGGRILIDSKLGIGTKFTLKIPIPKSVLIMNSLFVSVSGHRVGIPQERIQKVLQLEGEALQSFRDLEGSISFEYNSILVPVLFLSHLLEISDVKTIKDPTSLILVNTQNGYVYGLIVDEVLDVEDTVVKNILEQVNPKNAYIGATFLGDGRVGLLVNTDGLAALADITRFSQRQVSQLGKTTSSVDPINGSTTKLITFSLGGSEVFSVKQSEVFRVEEIAVEKIQFNGTGMSIPYRSSILEMYYLDELIGFKTSQELRLASVKQCLVFQLEKVFVGIFIEKVLDIVDSQSDIVHIQSALNGVAGLYILNKQTITLIDMKEVFTLSFQKTQHVPDVSA